jgi:hypothetical protein
MYYPTNDAQYALDRYNDKLREVEHQLLIRAAQSSQTKRLNQLQSQLAAWTNSLPRPQRNRAQRA